MTLHIEIINQLIDAENHILNASANLTSVAVYNKNHPDTKYVTSLGFTAKSAIEQIQKHITEENL